MFDIVKPCQSCKSHVLRPKEKITINFDEIVKETKRHSFEIIVNTGSMISLKKECKINIYSSGKVVVVTKDLNLVHRIASEIENILTNKKSKVVPENWKTNLSYL